MLEVGLDRPLAQEEPARDLGVRQPSHNEVDDLRLASGELADPATATTDPHAETARQPP